MDIDMNENDKEKYREQVRTATDKQLELALMLHAAAFNGKRPALPAPVYMQQAMFLTAHGYDLVLLPKPTTTSSLPEETTHEDMIAELERRAEFLRVRINSLRIESPVAKKMREDELEQVLTTHLSSMFDPVVLLRKMNLPWDICGDTRSIQTTMAMS